ncbi:hypothetical protein BDN70DRAFT_937705 [Pholiota conissans]|uniref:Uncharacterized protein n=1 Tax=Pholiota conissans TaxID=109636 RepID=A0A9P6CTI7_9AGAR|nr:hypothetical protein BDN70DRAFT_937705 [Pholiota conissans]
MHRLTTKRALVEFFGAQAKQFYDSHIYKTCTWLSIPLPSFVARPLTYLIKEIIDVRDQLLNVIEIQVLNHIASGKGGESAFPAIKSAFPSVKAAKSSSIKKIPTKRIVRDEVAGKASFFMDWYMQYKATKKAIQDSIDDFRRSRSIFGRTPKEAVRVNKAERMNAPNLNHLASGTTVHFYLDPERGRYGFTDHEPDYITVMDHYDSRGISLSNLRRSLGIESIAVITDRPNSVVFEPANENWLSHSTLRDLTKQNTRPLRVFENLVTESTKIKRTIREPIFLTLQFVVTLLKLVLGSPENNAYIQVLYGSLYAKAYSAIGVCTTYINGVFCDTLQLYFGLFVVLCMVLSTFVPFCVCFALGAARAMLAVAVYSTTLDAKAYLILYGLVWYGLAEYYSMTD